MMSSVAVSNSTALTPSRSFKLFNTNRLNRSPILKINNLLPSRPSKTTYSVSLTQTPKPLLRSCVNDLKRGLKVEPCRVYTEEDEGGGRLEEEVAVEEVESVSGGVGKKAKIGVYFATWWALNVVFNIYNKKVLNAFPYPWLTSTLSLAAGSLIMMLSWPGYQTCRNS